MLVQENVLNVEKSDGFEESTFKIRTTAKAFRILSSGLYSDKIQAIIRELSTNAADSHTMAGCASKPFHVHMPNQLEPFFSVRDFGVGLSPDDVQGIYTTYFESNKTASNDLNGCLGLGSKSPFSYTDTFTVVSYWNGTKYTYTAFINEHGTPSIAQLGSEPTQEGNGVEVSFPVNDNDFSDFVAKAERVYKYFDVVPQIVGQSVTITKPLAEYEESNWKLRRAQCGHYLVMGNVAYPINLNHRMVDVNEDLSFFQHFALEIHCNIGDAEFTASRESLEYTDKTINTIKKAVLEVNEHWKKLMLDKLASQPTYWQACLFYGENQLWLHGATWQGRAVDKVITVENAVHSYFTCQQRNYGNKPRYYEYETGDMEVAVIHDCIFIDNDIERGTKLRVLQYARSNPKVHITVCNFVDSAGRTKFMETCGLPPGLLIKASALPKVKYNKTGDNVKHVYEFSDRGRNKRTFWKATNYKDLPCNTEYVYVELDRYTPQEFGTVDDIDMYIRKLSTLGHDVVVYGVRKNLLKKIKNNIYWIRLEDKLKQVADANSQDTEVAMNTSLYMEYHPLCSVELQKCLPTHIDISRLIDKINYVVNNQRRLASLCAIMKKVGYNTEQSHSQEIDDLQNKYPLLFVVMKNVGFDNMKMADLAKYVQLVNEDINQRGQY